MSNPNSVRLGAIRWDGWYPTSDATWQKQATNWFDLPAFQFRAPFFATKTSDYLMSVNGNSQATIDAEIAYAKAAKIAYWAFDWYDPANATNGSLHQAWTLYQSSAHKADVNWCVMSEPSAYLFAQMASGELVTLMLQSNYEKVLTNRPLLYIQLTSVPGAGTALAAAIAQLRTDCLAAGLGSPYVAVLVFGLLPSSVATACTNLGADAITMYNWGPSANQGTHASLSALVATQWDLQAATGLQVVPTAVFGWDQRPAHARPTTFYTVSPIMNWNNRYITATASECAADVQALINWMAANPASCLANTGLCYAWNEFGEGGWCCPTWTVSGPDTSRLDAIAAIL